MKQPHPNNIETCKRLGHQPIGLILYSGVVRDVETPFTGPAQRVPGIGSIRPAINACARCGTAYVSWTQA